MMAGAVLAIWEAVKPFRRALLYALAAAAVALVAWLWFQRQMAEAYAQGKADRIEAERVQMEADKSALRERLKGVESQSAEAQARLSQVQAANDELIGKIRDASANRNGVSCLDANSLQLLNRFQFKGKHGPVSR
jgi:septal ring factor EnvC (AmiA/AmiB activator)